jgi:very-short-patch-repair endonuclease
MQAIAHPRVDERVAALAFGQAGVVSRRQLTALGIGAGAVEHRLVKGLLHHVPRHRGVFFVGHAAKGPRTMYWAAHLAIGPESVISHRSAAALHGVRASNSAYVELTVPGPSRRRAAIRVHRTTWLPDADVTTIDGLPVTTLERTLLDVGAVVDLRGVERAFDQAVVLGRVDMLELGRVLHEGAARPGAAKLRVVLARDAAGTTVTENGLEELLLAIIRRAGLPEPICQHPVLTYRADFCWPRGRLVVEADGPSHDTPSGRAHDAHRDAELARAGWRVLRFPKREILGDPAYVAAALGRALA